VVQKVHPEDESEEEFESDESKEGLQEES